MTWYCRIQSTAVSKDRDVRWCGFRHSIPLSIDYIWKSCIDMDNSTPSCSYCIWNRYCQKSSQHFSEFPIVCLIWYAWIKSSAMFKQQDIRWYGFRYSIPLSNDYVWNSCIDMAISILSCLHCICNRYRQNHRSILPNILLFAWFDTLKCNRLPYSNNKIYDDADFADRFRYQLATFGIRVLIWLSWLLHAHIAYI